MALPRRLAAALGALALVGCGLLAVGTSAGAAAPTLTADRTDGLLDGSAVTLTGSGYPAGMGVSVLQCRAGDYPVGADMTKPVSHDGTKLPRWQADCNSNEPQPKLDNSGTMRLGVPDARGDLTVTMYVKEGETPLDVLDAAGKTVHNSYTCDEKTPCVLVVMDANYYTTKQTLPITFAAEASTTCAAPTATTPSGTGPYSISSTYSRWAAASCATGTACPLLADYTDTGEAAGLSAFAAGQSDFAITATGFTGPGGSDIANSRPAVLTPLAVTAAVIAYDGGSTLPDQGGSYKNAPDPVTDLSLTQAEVAELFSSPFGTSAQQSPEILKRNPQLTKITSLYGNQAKLMSPDGVIATPDANVLAMTSAWAAVPDSPWTRGVLRAFPSSLGNNASDSSSIPLLSTLPALTTRVLTSTWTGPATPAPQVFLYLTDSATAARLGLHVAALQNAAGNFVAPTPDSIAAGVRGMKAGADGVLTPDPANAEPAAYPLPLVEYAVTPRDATDDIAGKKAPLVQFLTYATTTGQRAQDLAPGVFPLPGDLQAQAAASLPLVASAVTAAGPSPSATPSSGSAGSSLPGTGGGLPRATLPRTGGTVPGPAVVPPVAPGAPPAPSSSPTPAQVALPAFTVARSQPLGGLLPPIGVVALAGLLCAAAYGSSGRPWPVALTARAGRARAGATGLAGRAARLRRPRT